MSSCNWLVKETLGSLPKNIPGHWANTNCVIYFGDGLSLVTGMGPSPWLTKISTLYYKFYSASQHWDERASNLGAPL